MRYVLFILFLYSCVSPQPVTPAVNADSLITVVQQRTGYFLRQNQHGNAIAYLDSVAPYLRSYNDVYTEVAWHAYKGAAFTLGENDSANYYLTTAMRMADQSALPKASVIARIHLISYLTRKQQFDSALHHGLRAMELSKLGAPREVPHLYLHLSRLYRYADDTAKSHHYLFEGFKIISDSLHLAAYYAEFSRHYSERNEPDSADFFYKKFQHFDGTTGKFLEARKQEDAAQRLMQQGRWSEAVTLFKQVIDLYRDDPPSLVYPYFNTGISYRQLGLLDPASRYLDTALSWYRMTGDLENVSNTLFHQSTILLQQGKYEQAYLTLDSSYIYHLQFDTVALRNRAKEVEANILARLKDERISNLAGQMQASEKIGRQRLFIILALLLAATLLVAFSLVIFRRRKMKLLLKEAELQQRLLRSQMAPHFIFNSLSVLQAYIRTGSKEQATEFLSKFSKLLRLSLENARHSFVTLRDELAALEHYLSLQSQQTENRFDYIFEIAPDISPDDILIPPMLIQPFAENAITHGFTNLPDRGWLTIKITKQSGTIRCAIEDNGWGLHNSSGISSKRSLSTIITKERLEILGKQFSRNAGVEVVDKSESENGRGIRVTLIVPFQEST